MTFMAKAGARVPIESSVLRTLARMLAVLALCGLAYPQAHPTEYQVKAAYLYNFGKFVSWPAADSERPEFSVCILGEDPFGASLDSTISNATISGKKVLARRVATPQDAAGCQIVFVASSESGHLERDLPVLDKIGTLTVSDLPNFLERGGMIQFVEQDRRVRFEVNLKAAKASGIDLSSELLKVALKVQQ